MPPHLIGMDKEGGRKLTRQGQKRRLTAEQELHIQRLMGKNCPEPLKLTFALWSRAAVLLLVQQEFGFERPIRTKDKLKEAPKAHMDLLKKQPERVRS